MHGKATGNHNIFYLSKIIYNTYKLWHIRINNLNEVIVFQVIMPSSRCRSTKITAPNMISFFFCFFFLSCWSVQPNNSSSNMIWTIDVALDGLPESEGEFYCWRHQALQIQDSEKSSWVWPENLFPGDWEVLGRTMQATKMERRKNNQLLHLSVLPTDHNNDQHDNMSQNVHQWHLILSGKQQTCSWIEGILNRRESMLDIANLANSTLLVSSWILEESLLQPLY